MEKNKRKIKALDCINAYVVTTKEEEYEEGKKEKKKLNYGNNLNID